MENKIWPVAIIFALFAQIVIAQEQNIKEYSLEINKNSLNITGKSVMGMTVNGTIPGPILEFIEGDLAIINVTNNMDVETSVHWHGILLPNFYDGVPYLNTPPIKPGESFTYKFTLKQSGTYWYHSHTMLQEQKGVYGAIVIQPKEKSLKYDSDLVLLLSDWTDEKPKDVLRTLKRGTEWYNVKKGTTTPLNQVVARGGFAAQLDFWRQRMEGADIADVYYPAFLINGKQKSEYNNFKPGEKVRLRIINGAASTAFWINFGGDVPTLIAADGLNVVPIMRNKTFIGNAETYDYIITIPKNNAIEFKITAQDGSGSASTFIGNGDVLKADDLNKPDKIGMMMKMADMKMKMGAHALKFQPNKDERHEMKAEYGMQMDHSEMEHSKMNHNKMESGKMDHSKMKHSEMKNIQMDKDSMKTMNKLMQEKHIKMKSPAMEMDSMPMMEMNAEYNYDYLRSLEKTTYNKNAPVKEILLNLTGNMNRYIWSFNGVPLAETDKIKINEGEVTRITFNNLTMMHHPLHLHGHFFRVINKNGDYSPLKHTVNVPPMREVTIEFYGDEYGDWFFHCHILYHMMSGMTRIFSYDTPRDERMKDYSVSKMVAETNQYYSWGMLDVTSHMAELNLTSSNLRNQFNLSAEYGWNKNLEAEFTYDYYLHDYLRVFAGVNLENELKDSLHEFETTAVLGLKYLTPYLFNLDVRVDNKLRPQVSLSREIMIFTRVSLFGIYEYQADFGLIDNLPMNSSFEKEITWNTGFEYLVSKNISLTGSYDNRFGAGAGLSIRF